MKMKKWLPGLALLALGPLVWSWSSASPSAKPTPTAAVGLALEIENGVGVPLRVRAGQEFFVNQIDLRTVLDAGVDEGVAGLAQSGDFADLDWSGVALAEQELVGLPNGDGTFVRRRFYRDARWMEQTSVLHVTPVDAAGRPTAPPVVVHAGSDDHRLPSDGMFVRRLRAIQWTRDCASPEDCSGAHVFEEEALVELRHARDTAAAQRTFSIGPAVAAIEVRWSRKPGTVYTIPVEQIAAPSFAYGFAIGLAAVTPPQPDGTYAAGSDVTFELTLRDGAGNRLHPQGSLPTYAEVVFGPEDSGIQYYRAFFDPTTTYYRRKHRERMLMAQIIGPAQSIQPLRSIAELEDFLGPNDTQVVALPARDGVFSEFQLFPPANDLFGGAFDPDHAGWFAPVSDRFTFHLPADAEPGTYLVTTKGRRTYLGEDVAATTTVEIQVGTPAHTQATLATGSCNTCHRDGGELGTVLHANANRAACNGCHVPLGFELEGPIFVRLHFIHSRSNRFDAPLDGCSTCHLSAQSVQRTSKAACLSCHQSYPQSHVDWFGPVVSMYIGGERESFDQCTDACHQTHPGSGF
jgi:hypothetical protein